MRERVKRLVRLLSRATLPALLAISVLTTAVGLTSLTTTPAHAADGAPIVGIAGKCLDLQGGVAQNGNKVQLYTCNSSAAQNWQPNADGTIRNQGKCLDVRLGGTDPGSLVQLYDCNGSNAQRWQIESDGSILNIGGFNNLCLDSQHGGTTNRTQIQIYTCNDTNAQHWAISTPAAAAPPTSQAQSAAPAASAPAASQSTGDGYTNVDGNHVNSPSSNPAGATAQCADGTYSYSQHRSGTCSHHGGVAQWL